MLSILATFGIYVLASLIHYDPWHMVTSLVQYLLIAPSYISVMNVYAFCNTHDVSWGTKGQDKVATDLGVVTSGKSDGNKDTAEVNVTCVSLALDMPADVSRLTDPPAHSSSQRGHAGPRRRVR